MSTRPFKPRAVFIGILLLFVLSAQPGDGAGLMRGRSPAPPDSGFPAYYIVVQRQADGSFLPVKFTQVELAEPLVSLDLYAKPDADVIFSGRNCEPLEILLQTKTGAPRFRDLMCIPRWVRAEFHGEDGAEIDGEILEQLTPTFALRVPAMPATDLILTAPGKPPAAAMALDELALNTAPIDLSAIQADLQTPPPPADPANRVDLLVIGDGYTSGQSALFDSQAAAAMTDFFTISPYAEYENYFNISTLFVASVQSGADHPPYNASCPYGDLSCCTDNAMNSDPLAGTFVDTAFDSSYCYYGIHRLMYVNLGAVYAAAAAAPDWDVIFVLVNDTTYGGAGGSVMVASTHASAAEIAQHEFGHTFVDLADEYESAYPGYPACSDVTSPPCEPNVTDVTTRASIKWEPWIDALTPVPTVPEWDPSFANVVGLFEGARYFPTGIFRSGQSCIMRTLGAPYCQVPSQAFVLRLYQGGWGTPWGGISMIEPGSASPASSGVTLTHPGAQSFHVDILEPIGGPPAEITWYVDGAPVSGETTDTFLFTTDPGLPNPVEVRVHVEDVTTLVHPDMAGTALDFEQAWTVTTDYELYLPLILR